MKTNCSRILFSAAVITLLSGTLSHAASGLRSRTEAATRDSAPRIAAGSFHTCQVNEDGTVRCWGDNSYGQLGDGTAVSRANPAAAIGINNAVAIAAGFAHTCALLATGGVSCWGNNAAFELGVGALNDGTKRSLAPLPVSGITNAIGITSSAGASHTCALIADGTARCWGDNSFGALGDGSRTTALTPALVKTNSLSPLISITSVAAGGHHSCALLADSSVRCWGWNGLGQLGDGSGIDQLFPIAVKDLTNAVGVSSGGGHTCALLGTGVARCWGLGSSGQLGDGTTTNRPTPVPVVGVGAGIALASGANHTCALLSDGTARCWGANGSGQLGNGFTINNTLPAVVSGANNVVFVSAGQSHSCDLLADGTAHCWGDNSSGQLGDGTFSNSLTPNTVPVAGSTTGRSIAAGGSHTCAVRANGTVSCWGLNSSGQLGDGTTTNRLAPVAVVTGFSAGGFPIPLTNVVAVTAGQAHTCALLADGSARCWGENSKGQLGDSTTTTRLLPVAVPGLGRIVVALAAGDNYTCARTVTGTNFCWGDNSRGQLGDGSATTRLSPTLVSGSDGSARTDALAAGQSHTCALLASGLVLLDSKVICWGAGTDGQLGNGGLADHPFADSTAHGLISAVSIATGSRHSCALLVDGSARCWGANASGALGNGTTAPLYSPGTVSGTTNSIALAAGDFHTCVLLAGSTAVCWGDNSAGQIGDGTTTTRLTPSVPTILVLTTTATRGGGSTTTLAPRPLSNLVRIAAGRLHTCAIGANGSVRCWGDNTFGQLGIDSATSPVLRPAVVPSFTLNIDPKVALDPNGRVTTVTVVAECDAGQEIQIDVSLTQGAVSGRGSGAGQCTGGLNRYPVTVTAEGPNAFAAGSATVSAGALIRDTGLAVEIQEWTRQVNIVVVP